MINKLIFLLTTLLACSITLPCFSANDYDYSDWSDNDWSDSDWSYDNDYYYEDDSDDTYSSESVRFLDLSDSLTASEEDEILTAAADFSKRSGFSVGFVTSDYIGEDKSDNRAIEYSEDMYEFLFGKNSDGILLFINSDTKYDNICVHGVCEEYYNRSRLADIFTVFYDKWDESGLKSACLLFVEKIEYYYDMGAVDSIFGSGFTEENTKPVTESEPQDTGKPIVKILDEWDYLTSSQESSILSTAAEFSAKSDFNIIFVISDDIGSDKSDNGVTNYADDVYDNLCGINTDGILLLINNDTKYDWISTSGSCINYYSDERIDRIFDRIYDDIVAGDYYSACIGFVEKCESYYDRGKDNNQVGFESGDGYIEVDPTDLIPLIFFILVFTAVISAVAYGIIMSPYRLKKAAATIYTVPGSLVFSTDITESKGVITTRTYSPRSSGSGGSRGGRSSTHRSSSGGRHGGGERRR